MTNTVWLIAGDDRAAAAMAAELGLPVVAQPPGRGFYLHAQPEGLVLRRADAREAGLRVDLLDGALARRARGARRSALARAAGLHRHPPMRVLDTTCGLGADSATLARLGCEVTALERHPALYALVADARKRAENAPAPPRWLAHWRELAHADAKPWLDKQPARPFDLIYMDPMFAGGRRKARPQKALVWLAELVGGDSDAPALLAAAREHALQRVVVKQHARAAPLALPDFCARGKAVRFDIYLTPASQRS